MRAIIDKYAGLPFEYGFDCCAFVAECIEAQTGQWLNLDYRDENEANRLLARHGSLEAAITSVLGEPYFGYEDGFVALIKTRKQQVAGVFYRGRILVRVQNGLNDLPPHRAAKVWNPCRSY